MELRNNQFKSVQQYFYDKLKAHYSRNEIKIFLEMACDAFFGWSKMDLMLNESYPLSESEILRFVYLQKELKEHKPIQYILNQGDFWGLKLELDERVLIPRPETEELVAWLLEDFKEARTLKVIDVGTGSGCIPLAIKSEKGLWTLVGVDVDESVLKVAAKNGKNLDLEVQWQQKDVLKLGLDACDLIISNPPYIPQKESATMEKHVTQFEPALALFVPDEAPLLFYSRLLELFASNTAHTMYWEIHQDYVKELEMLLNRTKFKFSFRKDINNNPRMVKIEK